MALGLKPPDSFVKKKKNNLEEFSDVKSTIRIGADHTTLGDTYFLVFIIEEDKYVPWLEIQLSDTTGYEYLIMSPALETVNTGTADFPREGSQQEVVMKITEWR